MNYFYNLLYFIICMSFLFSCMYIQCVLYWCPRRSKGIEFLVTEISDDCELLNGSWELNLKSRVYTLNC